MPKIYHKESEFTCCPKCDLSYDNMDEDFIHKLNIARGYSEIPYYFNSTIRCKQHNIEVGGSVTSSHPKGLAADIKCITAYNRYMILYGLSMAGLTRFKIYKTFIHVDDDPDKPKQLIIM